MISCHTFINSFFFITFSASQGKKARNTMNAYHLTPTVCISFKNKCNKDFVTCTDSSVGICITWIIMFFQTLFKNKTLPPKFVEVSVRVARTSKKLIAKNEHWLLNWCANCRSHGIWWTYSCKYNKITRHRYIIKLYAFNLTILVRRPIFD